MINPFPESALNQEAGKLFMEEYNEFYKIAKIYTEVHANQNKLLSYNKSNVSNSKNNSITKDSFNTPSIEKNNFSKCFKSIDNNFHDLDLSSKNIFSTNNYLAANDLNKRRILFDNSSYDKNLNLSYNLSQKYTSYSDKEGKTVTNSNKNYTIIKKHKDLKESSNNINQISNKIFNNDDFETNIEKNCLLINLSNIKSFNKNYTEMKVLRNKKIINKTNNKEEMQKWISKI